MFFVFYEIILRIKREVENLYFWIGHNLSPKYRMQVTLYVINNSETTYMGGSNVMGILQRWGDGLGNPIPNEQIIVHNFGLSFIIKHLISRRLLYFIYICAIAKVTTTIFSHRTPDSINAYELVVALMNEFGFNASDHKLTICNNT